MQPSNSSRLERFHSPPIGLWLLPVVPSPGTVGTQSPMSLNLKVFSSALDFSSPPSSTSQAPLLAPQGSSLGITVPDNIRLSTLNKQRQNPFLSLKTRRARLARGGPLVAPSPRLAVPGLWES